MLRSLDISYLLNKNNLGIHSYKNTSECTRFSYNFKFKLNRVVGEHKLALGRFYCRYLDLCPMTLKLDRDIDILENNLHTENVIAKVKKL